MTAMMPCVMLGHVLKQDTRYVLDLEPRTYPKLSVKLYGRGVFMDAPADGGALKMKKHQFARPGQVILSEIWAKKGAIGIVPPEGNGALCTSHFFLFDIDEKRMLPDFIAWLLRANYFEPQLNAEARGTTGYAAIRPKQFLATSIPLPPLNEQRRIVARIEQLAAKVGEVRGLRQLIDSKTQQLSSAAVSTLVSASSHRSAALGDILNGSGLKNGKSIKSVPAESGIRCLTLGAVRDGRVDTTNSKPVPMRADEAKPYLVTKDDVFVVRGNGSKELCGRAALVADDTSDTVFPDLFIKISLARDVIDPRFFVAVWNASELRAWIEESAKTTSGIWKINQRHILAARIPLPKIKQQRQIVARLEALQSKIDSVKALQTATAAELGAMLPAILDKAFKGEL